MPLITRTLPNHPFPTSKIERLTQNLSKTQGGKSKTSALPKYEGSMYGARGSTRKYEEVWEVSLFPPCQNTIFSILGNNTMNIPSHYTILSIKACQDLVLFLNKIF